MKSIDFFENLYLYHGIWIIIVQVPRGDSFLGSDQEQK